jgi:23S rRNA pseudouridine1911/1915/1917 synthase
MSVVTRHGRAARTAWRVEKRFPRSRVSLLEVRPETGRTHQIRVHLSACGLPILGDTVYGRGSRLLPFPGARLGRPALHAQVLGFDRPGEGSRIRLEAPFPADLADLVSGLDAREQGL